MKFENLIRFFIKYRIALMLTLALLVVLGLSQTARKLTVDNALTIWFLDNNPQYQEYLQFQREQGSDQIVVAMLPIDSLFSPVHFSRLQDLHRVVDSLPFVRATLSLANLQYPLYANQKIYYRDFYTAERSAGWMKKLLDDLPALRDQLVTADGPYTFFYIQLDPNDVIEENRRAYVMQLTDLIRTTVGSVRITGPPIINEAFSVTIYDESIFFAIATILVVLILLLFLLPHWTYLPIAFSTVLITVSVTLGLMTSLGYSLNLISMLIPTILMVYAVSDSIHIINIFHEHRKKHPEQDRIQQIQVALRHSFKPCFYTTLTTVIGYLALSLSPLPAFKVTGWFTFLGIAIAFIVAYIVTAIGFYYMSEESIRGKVRKINIRRIVGRINHWTTSWNTTVLVVGSLIFVLGIGSLSLLKVSTNPLNLLGEGTVREDLVLIEKTLEGSARLQLNIRSVQGQAILDESILPRLQAFQDSLNANPLLSHPVSILNFKSFLEDRMSTLSRFSSVNFEEVLRNSEQPSNPFFTFFADDLSTLAININIKELETQQLEYLLHTIREDFSTTLAPGEFQLKIYGFPAVYAQLNTFILQTQLRSFGAAFLVSFCILFYFIGDLRTSLLALIPNLLPLCLTIIVMVLFGIPLEASNAMLAPIMLGVAMDDTIHLMNKYRLNRASDLSISEGMDKALLYTGGALFSTTIALVCGFLVVGLSDVASVAVFGLLCAFTILAALIADVVFLPALVKRFG